VPGKFRSSRSAVNGCCAEAVSDTIWFDPQLIAVPQQANSRFPKERIGLVNQLSIINQNWI
jgi:hypothetical protein